MILNEGTGETVIDGTDLHIVFTVEAWVWCERKLQKSVLQLLQDAMEMRMGFDQLATMVWCAAEAHRRRFAPTAAPVPEQQVWETIERAGGLTAVLVQVAEAIKCSPALGTQRAGAQEAPADDPFSSTPGPTLRAVPSSLASPTPGP